MSEIKIYFNKNTKKLEERVKLKKLIITPNYSFPINRRNIFDFKYQKRYPGPGQYNITTNNKLIYTFDKNRGSKFGHSFKSIFDKFYKKSSKESDRLYEKYEEKLRYKERIYEERKRKIETLPEGSVYLAVLCEAADYSGALLDVLVNPLCVLVLYTYASAGTALAELSVDDLFHGHLRSVEL